MEKANLLLTIILGALTLGGVIFAIYRTFDDPNRRQDKEIAVDKAVCAEKHRGLDDRLERIDNTLLLIKDNDLKHIEQRMNELSENQIKIFTILEERLSKKV
jgi:CRISPR/Cas system-associated endonuclease/helicase Cas3